MGAEPAIARRLPDHLSLRLRHDPVSDLPQLTTVPTVIDALLAAFREIPDSLDTAYGTLQVHDGPTYSSSAHDIIAVGVGDPGVVHQIIPQNRGVALNESYDIR